MNKKLKEFKPNPVRFENNIAYVSIFDKNGIQIDEFMIDEDDYDLIRLRRWFFGAEKYICSNEKKRKIYLHRFLLGGDSSHIDHVDRNKKNNRRNNLRRASYTQNYGNRNKHKTYNGRPTTSKFKGVFKEGDKWRASIKCGSTLITESFSDETAAAKQYNDWAIELFKQFANLNEI